MKVVTVVGARPQFIKAAPLSQALRAIPGVTEIIVHTGQHYDQAMSEVFFQDLAIPSPNYNLSVGSGSHGAQTGKMLEAIEEVLDREQPDVVLVMGDTNSTLAGGLAAVKLGLKVAHVEAGLRSFNRAMPEETNRVLTDHLSDLLFAPSENAVANLAKEGISGDRVVLVGDVMQDATLQFTELAIKRSRILEDWGLQRGQYILATIHRAENTDDPARLQLLFAALAQTAAKIKVILPLHPRTRDRAERLGLLSPLPHGLTICPPVGYLDMLSLEHHAAVIATDSGGVQKEAFFHRVPAVTLRSETEWVELIDLGWNRLAPLTSSEVVAETILAAVGTKGTESSPYGQDLASQKIAQRIVETVEARVQPKRTEATPAAKNPKTLLLKYGIYLGLALLPALIGILLCTQAVRAPIWNARPSYTFNDELEYWVTARSFMSHGLGGGYFAPNETPAWLSGVRWTGHGPFFTIVMGGTSWFVNQITSLFGRPTFSPPLVNVLWIGLAFLFFSFPLRNRLSSLLLFSGFAAFFWPIYFYVPGMNEEPLHQALALVACIVFLPLFSQKNGPRANWVRAACLFVFAISLVRLSWSILFVPLLVLSIPEGKLPQRVLRFGMAAGLILAMTLIWKLFITLHGHGWTALELLNGNVGLGELITETVKRLKAFTRPTDYLQFLMRLEALTVLFYSAWMVFAERRQGSPWSTPRIRVGLFNVMNLGIILSLILGCYYAGGYADWRVYTPHLLLSCALLIHCGEKKDRALLVLLTVLNFGLLKEFVSEVRVERSPLFTYDQTKINEFTELAEKKLVYLPSRNPWCNTVAVLRLPGDMATASAIPAGFGFSNILSVARTKFPLKSRYVLADDSFEAAKPGLPLAGDTVLEFQGQKLRLAPVVDTSLGRIFRNLDSTCDQKSDGGSQ